MSSRTVHPSGRLWDTSLLGFVLISGDALIIKGQCHSESPCCELKWDAVPAKDFCFFSTITKKTNLKTALNEYNQNINSSKQEYICS